MAKTEFFEEIGEVTFVTSKRAKNIGISIRPFKGVTVTVPYLVSHKEARKVLISKKKWIKNHLPKIKGFENEYTVFDEKTVFTTLNHKLKIESWKNKTYRITVKDKLIYVRYPYTEDIYTEYSQKIVRKAIENAWKIEAESYFPEKFKVLAQKYGFKYQSLTIKNTTSKWGSCSHDNHILLSLHLMRVPIHLQNYVMIHELCHTIEKNHQPPFWKLMDRITNGRAKALDKELKAFSTKIY